VTEVVVSLGCLRRVKLNALFEQGGGLIDEAGLFRRHGVVEVKSGIERVLARGVRLLESRLECRQCVIETLRLAEGNREGVGDLRRGEAAARFRERGDGAVIFS